MIHTFVADPMRIPSIALSFAKQREMATAYASAYSQDSGDTPREYIDRAAYDVYPASINTSGERANFKALLRAEMRRMGKR